MRYVGETGNWDGGATGHRAESGCRVNVASSAMGRVSSLTYLGGTEDWCGGPVGLLLLPAVSPVPPTNPSSTGE